MGLNAKPVAEVALPACHIEQLTSEAGSLRESYDRSMTELPDERFPANIAVTAVFVLVSLASYNKAFAFPHLSDP
jgi:hypothetical protein